ncbi:hypothetical protein FO519_000089 [Halicephalobus sp. NKZ332]|nr:hypothetical protein FO519_000089 [Halicephalobus sp. NKZ332]
MLGGISTVFTLSMAIVTDDCRNEHSMNSNGVPFRIAISAAVQQVGILCGSFIVTLFSSSPHVSVAKHVEGYVNMCLVSLLCSVAALLYCFIWMKDSYKVEKASENRRPLTEDTVEPVRSTSQSENRTWKENVKKFSYELVEVLCQRRAGWTRFCLNLFILFMFTDFLVNDTSLLCLLVKRPPLSWTDAQFSNFIVLRTLAGMVGMMLIPTIFNKLNFIGADSLMIIIGVFACIIINLMQSLGTSTGIIFATTFFTIFGGGLSPAYRTVLSKIIPQDQTARLFSIVSIILVLCPLVSSLIFNNIYEVTLNTWPGFVFFIYAIIHLIVLCGQILIYKLMYPLWEKDHYMNQGFVVTEDQERPLLVDQDDADFDAPQRSIFGGQASTQARSMPFELSGYPNVGIRNPSKRKITFNVEPAIFLFSLSFGVIGAMQTLFLYWARCVEIFKDQPGEEMRNVSKLCTEISSNNDTTYSDMVEKDIAHTRIYMQAVSTISILISAPIIGAVSDKVTGRRIPLLVCLFGFASYCGLQTLSVLYYETINVYYFMFGAEILSGILGGIPTVFTLSLAIVTDDCRNEHSMNSNGIPLRIAISSVMQQVGILIGSYALSFFSVPAKVSIIRHVEGYVNMCLVSLFCSIAALLYSFIWVKDSYKVKEAHENEATFVGDTVEPIVRPISQSRNKSWKENMKEFLYELVEVLHERRPGWTRFCLNLCMMLIFTDFLASDNSLLCLLVKRAPLSWTDGQFGNFVVLRTLASTVGMMLIPAIFNKLNFIGADSLMIMMGLFACIIISLMQSLAISTVMIFATAFFTIFGGGLSPGYRSILPKMVPQHHTARLFSIISIILVVCPLVSSLIFNNIFEATLNTWPGFVFFIYAIIHLAALCGQILIHKLMYPLWEKDHYMNQGFVMAEDQERPLLNEEDDADFDVPQRSIFGGQASTQARSMPFELSSHPNSRLRSPSRKKIPINVEPVIFLFSLSLGVISVMQPLFFYWARCVEIFKDQPGEDMQNVSKLCADISSNNDTSYSDIVERDIANMKIYMQNSNGVPLRIVISSVIYQVGVLCGNSIVTLFSSPPHVSVTKHIQGYTNMCLVFLLCSVAAILYSFIWVKDSYKVEEASENRRPLTEDTVEPVRSTSQSENRTWKEDAKRFLYETVEVLYEKRPGWTRFCLNLCILLMFTDFLINDTSLLCLFVKRPPLSWTDSQFSDFIVLKNLAGMVGMMLIPAIFNKLNFIGTDSLMIMMGLFACIIISLMQSFGTITVVIFATTPVTIFGACLSPGYRSILPKMVPQHHTGRLFSIVSVILVLCPLISNLVFNNIYEATLDVWSGFVFFIYAIFYFIALCGQILIHKLMYPLWKTNKSFVVTEDQERPLLVDQDDADFDVLDNHPDSILTNTSAYSGSPLEYNSTQERPNV